MGSNCSQTRSQSPAKGYPGPIPKAAKSLLQPGGAPPRAAATTRFLLPTGISSRPNSTPASAGSTPPLPARDGHGRWCQNCPCAGCSRRLWRYRHPPNPRSRPSLLGSLHRCCWLCCCIWLQCRPSRPSVPALGGAGSETPLPALGRWLARWPHAGLCLGPSHGCLWCCCTCGWCCRGCLAVLVEAPCQQTCEVCPAAIKTPTGAWERLTVQRARAMCRQTRPCSLPPCQIGLAPPCSRSAAL